MRTPPSGTAPPSSAPVTAVCNAQGAQFAVGKAPVASLVEQARQRSGSYMARVLRPGQVVTMEFNAQRLNLDLDAAGVITRVRCG
ncbi:I78 family peptidase inhibitor [Polaromonas sp.]|uniref:I78 family peptidase inhibitor n=1 Tax=Polaromonas sp. TaxID=1869339 RepID=UPI002D77045E|nr:I78 family peptidase inhibitor [Polaromonas sp.]